VIRADGARATALTVRADLTTVDAGSKMLTDFVRSRRGLHVERFPRSEFKSRQIAGAMNAATVVGELSLRGVRRTIEVRGRASVSDTEARAETSFSIEREDYEISPGAPAEWVLSDELEVFVELVAVPMDEEAACPIP
jgi:polyisoprenoid-binding protein YceI